MAVEDVVSSDLNTDIYVCVGFGLAFAGFIFSQIWWIFGGTLIFVSPFMGAFMDDELEKRRESKEFWID
jgi:hypothetical protein